MQTERNPLDWNGWYASIPGIPTDWGRPRVAAARTAPRPRLKRVLVWLPEPA